MYDQCNLQLLCEKGGVDRTVVSFDREQAYDWGALKQRIADWEGVLGTHPGQRFALYIEHGFEFTAALLAALRCRKTVYLCAQISPEMIAFLQKNVAAFIGDFAPEYTPLTAAPTQRVFTPGKIDARQEAIRFLTSGSTGYPKVIGKNVQQLSDEVAMLEKQWLLRQCAERIVSTVNHHHFYGFIFRFLWPLLAGRPSCADNIVFLEYLPQYVTEASILISSPAHLKRLSACALPWDKFRIRIKMIFSSGGALSDKAVEGILGRLSIAINEIYGSTETGALATRVRCGPASLWQALPGVILRMAQATQQLQAKAAHLPGSGWFNCDDVVDMTGEGMQLLGRSDDIVKLEGKRIALPQINQALETSMLVIEAHCLLLEGQRDSIGAVIVLSEEGRILLAKEGKKSVRYALQNHLQGKLYGRAIPRRFRYLFQLPVNSQGKIRNALLTQVFMPPAEVLMPILLEQTIASAQVTLQVYIPDTLRYLTGHFPHWPVVPGVAQLEWVMRYIRLYLVPDFSCQSLDMVKFMRPIEANTVLLIKLAYCHEKYQVEYSLTSLLGLHASGRVRGELHAV